MYSWIVDVLFLVIALITVIVYAKRGFVQSLFKHGRVLASGILAFSFGPMVGDLINTKFIYNGVYNWVWSKVSTIIDSTTGGIDLEGMIESLPFLVKQFVDPAALQEKYGQVMGNLEVTAQEFSASVATPVSGIISNLLAYVAVFLVSMLLLLVLGFLLDLLTKLPIVHGVNCFLGFLLGVLAAFVLLSLLTYVISLVVGIFVSSEALDVIINNTLLFKLFSNIQLFNLF